MFTINTSQPVLEGDQCWGEKWSKDGGDKC